jgi:uncharacterized protein
MYFNIIFSLAFFSLLFLGIFLVANLLITSFSLKKKGYKLGIYIITVALIINFILSLILVNSSSNNWLSYFYITSALLFGLLSQLMLFGLIFQLLSWFLKDYRNKANLAKLFLFFSILTFFLGLYNAFNVKIKTVNLENYGGSQRIALVSDLHLGHIYGPSHLSKIISKLNQIEADIIIISGDLFDGSDREIDEFIDPLKELQAPTIFVFGNHDVYTGFKEEVRRVVSQAGLIELSDQAMLINNLEIIGFDYISNSDSNIRREIKDLLEEKVYPRIVVNHVPVDYKEAQALGADLFLAGHTHRGQIFPMSIITTLIYGKNSYGLSNYLDMLSYTSSGVGTWGPPIRTPFKGEIVLFNIK